jgi:alpha,alpha-trehalose-phosphate synthase [UDP-forming]/trehalose-phosphatase
MKRADPELPSSTESIIIASNREPYVHVKSGPSVKVSRPAGGLTSAMDEVLRSTGGKWIAWGSGSADRESVDASDRVGVPPGRPSYTLRRVWLTQDQVKNYYEGYSNQVLWPLCHIFLERVFFRKRYWDDYVRVNSIFADAILQEADERSNIWIHDYHLCLVPKMLREENPNLTIAHFWHIPWPDFDVFRICPQATELIKALLHNDLLGLQIPLFVRNFIECAKEALVDAEVDERNDLVSYRGHTTEIRAYPISIDFRKFDSFSQSSKTDGAILKLKDKYRLHGRYIGIGVDRLEYTKGLIKRFQAIDHFFDSYPEFREKFSFIQITVSTRINEPYLSYKSSLERLIRNINRKHATEEWVPVISRDTKTEHADLAAYYRMADVAIISSIYDGMNLVAKEFVAAQSGMSGVLLLSEFTGAAEELEGAILFNPYDTEGFAESIRKALTMPDEEKKYRMKTLRTQCEEKDIYRWISDIIGEISLLSSSKPMYKYVFNYLNEIPQSNIFLFLDYDGTITPIASSPDKAVLSEHTRSLILKLREIMPVAIITGRSLENIKSMVRLDNVIFAGNHGAEIWDGTKLVVSPHLGDNINLMENMLRELKESLSSVPGVFIEEKGITASVHYREIAPQDTGKVFDRFWSIADRHKDLFRITSGKKVLEIRPYGIWNKGDAVKWILKNLDGESVPLYIGDDVTDEDAFKVLRGTGISICIGKSQMADYYLKTQDEVGRFLLWIGQN